MIIVGCRSRSIIQFMYGDDGMDATFVESQPLEIIKLSTENINHYFDEKQIGQ